MSVELVPSHRLELRTGTTPDRQRSAVRALSRRDVVIVPALAHEVKAGGSGLRQPTAAVGDGCGCGEVEATARWRPPDDLQVSSTLAPRTRRSGSVPSPQTPGARGRDRERPGRTPLAPPDHHRGASHVPLPRHPHRDRRPTAPPGSPHRPRLPARPAELGLAERTAPAPPLTCGPVLPGRPGRAGRHRVPPVPGRAGRATSHRPAEPSSTTASATDRPAAGEGRRRPPSPVGPLWRQEDVNDDDLRRHGGRAPGERQPHPHDPSAVARQIAATPVIADFTDPATGDDLRRGQPVRHRRAALLPS